ncbi:MAG: hypothetical protein ACYTAO_22210, partial [Planctomycetota bacterium]
MAEECCDKTCETPFCPTCGKAQTEEPIDGLIAYLNKSLASSRARVRNATRRQDQFGDPKTRAYMSIDSQVL